MGTLVDLPLLQPEMWLTQLQDFEVRIICHADRSRFPLLILGPPEVLVAMMRFLISDRTTRLIGALAVCIAMVFGITAHVTLAQNSPK